LDHPGAPAEAARAIHVHPNTMRYRMARIADLAGLDLDDPVVRLAVRLQLEAERRRTEAR
jgi:DNA-binding PucR family transcriptional regulator